jgi:hypothetical protein
MATAGTTEFVYPFDEGPAVLTFPDGLSPDGLAELKDWLALAGKKIDRLLKAQGGPAADQSPADGEEQ